MTPTSAPADEADGPVRPDAAGGSVPPDAAAGPGRWRRTRDVLAPALYPDATTRPVRWWAVVGLVVGFAALSLFRVPWPLTLQRVWAEDGQVFLLQQERLGYWHALRTGYAGYLHAVPRTAAALVAAVPVAAQAAALALVTAAVVGAAAAVVAVVVRDLTGRTTAGLLAGAYLVMAPLGYETLGNLANLQWRLLPAALLVAWWTPRTRGGVVAAVLAMLAATTSSPFAVLVVVVVALRCLLRPSRLTLLLTGVTVLGTALQGAVMLTARARTLVPTPGPRQLVDQYALRVVAEGLFGERTIDRLALDTALRIGQLVTAGVVVLLLVAAARGGRTTCLRVLAMAATSAAAYLAPMLVGAPALEASLTTRYFVAPAALLVVTLLVAVPPRVVAVPAADVEGDVDPAAGAGAGGDGGAGGRRRAAADRVRAAGRRWWDGTPRAPWAATAVLAVAMTTGGVIGYPLPTSDPYGTTLRWDDALAAARAGCRADPDGTATIAVNPRTWYTQVPCSRLR